MSSGIFPSPEVFDKRRRPRFGTANPERIRYAFWEWMIRPEAPLDATEEGILAEVGQVIWKELQRRS